MRRGAVFLLTIWFWLSSGCAPASRLAPPPANCRAFHVGRFAFRPQGGHAPWSYTITRTDSVQTEVVRPTGARSILAITWLNECTYQLRLLSSTVPFPDSIQRLRRQVPLTTQILQTTDRYCIFRTQRALADPIMVDTLWIDP